MAQIAQECVAGATDQFNEGGLTLRARQTANVQFIDGTALAEDGTPLEQDEWGNYAYKQLPRGVTKGMMHTPELLIPHVPFTYYGALHPPANSNYGLIAFYNLVKDMYAPVRVQLGSYENPVISRLGLSWGNREGRDGAKENRNRPKLDISLVGPALHLFQAIEDKDKLVAESRDSEFFVPEEEITFDKYVPLVFRSKIKVKPKEGEPMPRPGARPKIRYELDENDEPKRRDPVVRVVVNIPDDNVSPQDAAKDSKLTVIARCRGFTQDGVMDCRRCSWRELEKKKNERSIHFIADLEIQHLWFTAGKWGHAVRATRIIILPSNDDSCFASANAPIADGTQVVMSDETDDAITGGNNDPARANAKRAYPGPADPPQPSGDDAEEYHFDGSVDSAEFYNSGTYDHHGYAASPPQPAAVQRGASLPPAKRPRNDVPNRQQNYSGAGARYR